MAVADAEADDVEEYRDLKSLTVLFNLSLSVSV